jgi:hypothetical protein
VTTGRGREKSGESEENRERDVEGDTCHVCIEREKKSLQLSTQLNVAVWHCSCCFCLCWLEKKMYLCILMIHVCIEREKKIFAIVNSTECSCAALQQLLLLVLASKKNVFVYFNDSRVYRERKKNLVQFPIDSSCAALQLLLLLCWLEKKILFVYFIDKKWAYI